MVPFFSVIVPVYNVEPYLRQCVDSILAQTLENFELILVDDGSPDGCGAICDGYARQDSRVKVIHKQNGGVMSALCAGIEAACADHVGFVDGDDWIDPDYYESLYRAAVQEGADMVIAEAVEHRGAAVLSHPTVAQRSYPAPDGGRQLLSRFFLQEKLSPDAEPPVKWKCDKLYRRALLTANMPYFSSDVWCGEDVVMNAAILADCQCVRILSGGAKYHYRYRQASASHTFFGHAYDERHLANDIALHGALARIARDKGLDPAELLFYRGRYAYLCFYKLAQSPELRLAQKRDSLRRLLSAVPPEALGEYARLRGGLFIRLFCAMLRAGLITPCVWTVRLHAALTGQKD